MFFFNLDKMSGEIDDLTATPERTALLYDASGTLHSLSGVLFVVLCFSVLATSHRLCVVTTMLSDKTNKVSAVKLHPVCVLLSLNLVSTFSVCVETHTGSNLGGRFSLVWCRESSASSACINTTFERCNVCPCCSAGGGCSVCLVTSSFPL